MKDLNKNLSQIFNVDPIEEVESTPKTEIVTIPEQTTVEADAQTARNNIRSLLKTGNRAIEELATVARDSQHPRAYEVMAGMLKNLAEMNKDLLDIEKKKQELTGTKPSESKDVNIDKAVFVGSTAELMKLLNKKE